MSNFDIQPQKYIKIESSKSIQEIKYVKLQRLGSMFLSNNEEKTNAGFDQQGREKQPFFTALVIQFCINKYIQNTLRSRFNDPTKINFDT